MTWHSVARLDALPVARLHPLVRNTSAQHLDRDLLALTELAARLLNAPAAVAGENGEPGTAARVR